ncbi:MAG: galactokinase [Brevibacterium sp.]|uniref:galactokinase n=1 Tax=Brevibacterium sp. TaxID=1701 RepID=UPI002649161D|nr:galactokinase [Brevibacterium sp.]MDN5807044.1 galactokinase [Brevibacterium sp.]MDN6157142.1 galactokinase [Brevibacterium sp.]MDN6176085.1 galactokinase [Brevibacterium sp.]MDN6189285.1 galactokinase [Brevibacterium sp.]MDN6192117.1 galactokinase [Brevibacterium sp.]
MNAATPPTGPSLRREFEAVFGYPPLDCFRAPGRVNLIGEHTDYNMGLVLPIAIDRAVHVAIGRRPQGRWSADDGGTATPPRREESIRIVSDHRDEWGERLAGQFTAEELVPGALRGWLSHPAGVGDEIAKTTGTAVGGIDLYIESTVPVGAGLSSSHALEVAVLIALDGVCGLGLDDREKVLLTQRAENDFVGAPTGIVDQAASVMAEAGYALFLDCRDLATRQIPFDLDAEELRLLVIDTRVSHSHSESGYGDRRRTCEEAAGALGVESLRELDETVDLGPLTEEQKKRVRHVFNENARVRATVELLEGHGGEGRSIRGIGELLLASHDSLTDDFEVSCTELDTAVAAAMSAGAIGARMIGGGFGGSAIALVDAALVDEVGKAVLAAFAEHGHRAPDIFAVRAGTGAGRID